MKWRKYFGDNGDERCDIEVSDHIIVKSRYKMMRCSDSDLGPKPVKFRRRRHVSVKGEGNKKRKKETKRRVISRHIFGRERERKQQKIKRAVMWS